MLHHALSTGCPDYDQACGTTYGLGVGIAENGRFVSLSLFSPCKPSLTEDTRDILSTCQHQANPLGILDRPPGCK